MKTWFKRIHLFLSDFFFGAMTYEMYRESIHLAKIYNDAVELLLLGHFLGIPFLPNYYTLRLLPYIIDRQQLFKTQALKEVDIFSIIGESGAH